eukprot:SAG31_NODE_455_length_15433_cov_4.248728_12_plen_51_part_00
MNMYGATVSRTLELLLYLTLCYFTNTKFSSSITPSVTVTRAYVQVLAIQF